MESLSTIAGKIICAVGTLGDFDIATDLLIMVADLAVKSEEAAGNEWWQRAAALQPAEAVIGAAFLTAFHVTVLQCNKSDNMSQCRTLCIPPVIAFSN